MCVGEKILQKIIFHPITRPTEHREDAYEDLS